MRALVVLGVILLAGWFVAFAMFKITAAALHLLLIAAVILFIVGFVRGRAGAHHAA